jgi:hypothetical protein
MITRRSTVTLYYTNPIHHKKNNRSRAVPGQPFWREARESRDRGRWGQDTCGMFIFTRVVSIILLLVDLCCLCSVEYKPSEDEIRWMKMSHYTQLQYKKK